MALEFKPIQNRTWAIIAGSVVVGIVLALVFFQLYPPINPEPFIPTGPKPDATLPVAEPSPEPVVNPALSPTPPSSDSRQALSDSLSNSASNNSAGQQNQLAGSLNQGPTTPSSSPSPSPTSPPPSSNPSFGNERQQLVQALEHPA